MRTLAKKRTTEFCSMCGRSVIPGSGWFVNRVPDLNSVEERRDIGRVFPRGDWVCAECTDACPTCDAAHSRHRTVLAKAHRTKWLAPFYNPEREGKAHDD